MREGLHQREAVCEGLPAPCWRRQAYVMKGAETTSGGIPHHRLHREQDVYAGGMQGTHQPGVEPTHFFQWRAVFRIDCKRNSHPWEHGSGPPRLLLICRGLRICWGGIWKQFVISRLRLLKGRSHFIPCESRSPKYGKDSPKRSFSDFDRLKLGAKVDCPTSSLGVCAGPKFSDTPLGSSNQDTVGRCQGWRVLEQGPAALEVRKISFSFNLTSSTAPHNAQARVYLSASKNAYPKANGRHPVGVRPGPVW